MKKCCYCGESFADAALRPYGPDGANTCFPCATSTPERERAAEQALGGILNAPGLHVITEAGVVTVHTD